MNDCQDVCAVTEENELDTANESLDANDDYNLHLPLPRSAEKSVIMRHCNR